MYNAYKICHIRLYQIFADITLNLVSYLSIYRVGFFPNFLHIKQAQEEMLYIIISYKYMYLLIINIPFFPKFWHNVADGA